MPRVVCFDERLRPSFLRGLRGKMLNWRRHRSRSSKHTARGITKSALPNEQAKRTAQRYLAFNVEFEHKTRPKTRLAFAQTRPPIAVANCRTTARPSSIPPLDRSRDGSTGLAASIPLRFGGTRKCRSVINTSLNFISYTDAPVTSHILSILALLASLVLSAELSAQTQSASQPATFFQAAGVMFALSVPDLDESVAWFRDKLGLHITMRIPRNDQTRAAIAILQGGGLTVELIKHDDATPSPAQSS